MDVDFKPLVWLGTSLESVREFPADARQSAGRELMRLQAGLMPTDWKPMATVGPGVYEIRVRVGREYRVFYLAKFAEAIYVLHAFEKKTRKTRELDVELARQRLRQLLKQRPSR